MIKTAVMLYVMLTFSELLNIFDYLKLHHNINFLQIDIKKNDEPAITYKNDNSISQISTISLTSNNSNEPNYKNPIIREELKD